MEKFLGVLKRNIVTAKEYREDMDLDVTTRYYHEGRYAAYKRVLDFLTQQYLPAQEHEMAATQSLINELQKSYDLSIDARNELEEDLEAEKDLAHNLRMELAEALDEKDRLNMEIKTLKDLLAKRTQSVCHLDNIINFLDVAPLSGEVTTVLDFMKTDIAKDVDFFDHRGEQTQVPCPVTEFPIRIHTGDDYFAHIKILHPNEVVVPTITGGRKRFKLRKR